MTRISRNLITNNDTNRGFTLIEVLIALTIFSFGILAIASLQIVSINGNASARRSTDAATWAMDRMEQLIALPYDHADLDTDASANPHTEADDTGLGYGIQWEVADHATLNNAKSITLRVNDPRGNQRIELEFVKSQIL